jgi:hypothetical protein
MEIIVGYVSTADAQTLVNHIIPDYALKDITETSAYLQLDGIVSALVLRQDFSEDDKKQIVTALIDKWTANNINTDMTATSSMFVYLSVENLRWMFGGTPAYYDISWENAMLELTRVDQLPAVTKVMSVFPVTRDRFGVFIIEARNFKADSVANYLGILYSDISPYAPIPEWIVKGESTEPPDVFYPSLPDYIDTLRMIYSSDIDIFQSLVLKSVDAIPGAYTGQTIEAMRRDGPENPPATLSSAMFRDIAENDFFEGYCDICYRRIRKYRHAIRAAGEKGSWSGWYCSVGCLQYVTGCSGENRVMNSALALIYRHGIYDQDSHQADGDSHLTDESDNNASRTENESTT